MIAVDKIKMVRSFITGISDDEQDMAIIETIICLGENLGLKVIGEGAETEERCEFLLFFGCKFGQVCLIYGPIPPAEFFATFAPSLPKLGTAGRLLKPTAASVG